MDIGDPTVPSLAATLRHGSVSERWVSVFALKQIGSPFAANALRAHASRESDPNLRKVIETIVRKRVLEAELRNPDGRIAERATVALENLRGKEK